MAEQRRQAKNQSMFIRPPPSQPRQTWLWLAPYVAIGVFALAMLIVTGLLQWREQDTALSALEGDMHWAERTIEARLHGHQDFLTELGREQEFRQLTYESFQVRASRYVRDNPEISAIIWVNTEGKVEWVAPNESTVTFVGEQLSGIRLGALQEALRTHRALFSPDYAGAENRWKIPRAGLALSASQRHRRAPCHRHRPPPRKPSTCPPLRSMHSSAPSHRRGGLDP